MNKKKISSSMLAADFSNLEKDLKEAERAGSDWLHVDIMDGHFVPNITFGPDQLKMLRPKVSMFFDVHLMISHPEQYIPKFIDAGADLISVHYDTEDDLERCFEMLEEAGVKKGIVVSPNVAVEEIEDYLDRVDLVLVMGVYPGFGGQKLIPETAEKIKRLKELIGDRDIYIEVDGGINKETAKDILEAGADVIVAGTGIFKGNIEENINHLRKVAAET